jgi:hypothetical protein
MDPNAHGNLLQWTQLQTLFPNGVCPRNCQCMGDAWYAMCESLESPMEVYHEKLDKWVAGGISLSPAVPSKTTMMGIAADAYWRHLEEAIPKDNQERIYNICLPLPPCIHNNMSENIDLILQDLEEMRANKVDNNIGPFE